MTGRSAPVGVMLSAVLSLAALLGSVVPGFAAPSACDRQEDVGSVRPVAPAGLAADLPEPFAYRPSSLDRTALLRDVASVVSKQAAEFEADECFRTKAMRIAERVDFLSPFEFMVAGIYAQEPEKRDALLDQYKRDPRAAIRDLGQAFPTPRSQSMLATFAFYDLPADRIRVNAGRVPEEDLRRVLVHEFWHAMPVTRTWSEPGGTTLRASGFWLQEQRGDRMTWLPVEDRRGLPYESYLLDEAMATLMETRYAGPSKYSRADLEEVQGFLRRLMEAAGSRTVLDEYLRSRPTDLVGLVESHRSSFPDLEPVARP